MAFLMIDYRMSSLWVNYAVESKKLSIFIGLRIINY